MRAKKIFNVILCLFLMLSLMPTAAFAEGEGTFSFKMSISIAQGTNKPENYGVEYRVLDSTNKDAQGDSYKGFITSNEPVDINLNGLGEDYKIKFTVRNAGLGIRLNGTEVNKDEWSNGKILEFNQITNEYNNVMNFELFADNNGSDEPGPEPGPDPEPPHGGYEGNIFHSDLTITGEADFYINDSNMVNSGNGENQTVDYTYDGNGNVDFYIASFINARYTSFKINGTEYYDQIPTPETDEGRKALLDACKGQINEFKLTVPYSESGYVIEATQKFLDDSDADYWMVGNFLWTYTDKNQGDDYLDHGRMELIKMEYDGETYLPENLNNPGTAFDWSEDENGGSAVLPAGAVVTVKLVPEYGYQLTSFGVNGGSFGTGDQQSTFTFEIERGNFHLGAHFTPVDDKVSATAEAVTGGNIKIGEGEIDTGSVVLSVDDAKDLSYEQVEEFKNAATGYQVSAYLDINLDQVVYKGKDNADDAWKNEISELKKDATITLTLDEGVNGNKFEIIHEKHDGSYEVIPAEFDDEANTITFKTSSFSNYAVATTGHNFGEWKITKYATCTTDGEQERKCSACGETEKQTIKATGHKYITKVVKSTCTVKGYTIHSCSVCKKSYKDNYKNAFGHKYVKVKTVKPTMNSQGYTLYKCSVCGATIKKDFVAKLISVSKAKVSKIADKTYTGKQIKPKIKVVLGKTTLKNGRDYTVKYGTNKIGKGTITIAGKGKYTGKIVKSFKILPRKTSVYAKSYSKGKLTVKFNKKYEATKYQVQYARNKKFRGSKIITLKSKKTIKAISGKTYYVRVRTVKTVGTKNYVSGWSAVRKVKIK